MTIYLIAAFAVAFAAQLVVVRLVVQQQRATERLEERLGHLLAGISLLTDTTEGGLRDVALEMSRVSSPAAKPRTRAATARRLSGAVKRGRTVREIAANEQLSEGEVRLRLQLNEGLPRHEALPKHKVNHASMR